MIIIVIFITSAGVFYLRGYLDKRETVVAIVNKNTDIYNNSTVKSKELLINVKDLLDFTSIEQTEVKTNIEKLDTQISGINKLIVEINEDSKKLEKDNNSELLELYTTYQEGLATKKATLELLGGYVSHQVCIIKNSTQQYENITSFSENLNTFADNSKSSEDKLNSIQIANTKIQENTDLMTKISDCFKDQYSKYFTSPLQAAIQKDVELYKKYTETTNLLVVGLTNNDSIKLQDGTTQLLQLKDQNPALFSSEEFLKAINEPKKQIQEQATILENQEKKLTNNLEKIKQLYQIN